MILEDVALFDSRTEDLSDKEKYEILCNLWRPPVDYDFHVTGQGKKPANLFTDGWLNTLGSFTQNHWMEHSACLVCYLGDG